MKINFQAKCERYIPDNQSNQYGPFKIEVKSITYRTDYEIRRLVVEVNENLFSYLKYKFLFFSFKQFENEKREIEHYWYTGK